MSFLELLTISFLSAVMIALFIFLSIKLVDHFNGKLKIFVEIVVFALWILSYAGLFYVASNY